jgi:hypothetical protein
MAIFGIYENYKIVLKIEFGLLRKYDVVVYRGRERGSFIGLEKKEYG